MLIVDSLLVSGIAFVLTRLAEAVDAEMYDETALREELLAAQMKLELGEIGEDEFDQIEAAVLRSLREVAERKRAASGADSDVVRTGGKLTVDTVEATVDHGEHGS